MKKLLIPLIAGLVIGLAASTAAVAFMGGGEKSLAESLAENVSAEVVEGEAADSIAASPIPPEEPMPAEGSIEADTAAHVPAVQVMLEAGMTEAPLAPMAAGTVEAAMETSRLAKLFGSMQPREAARVLEHMNDYEVQVILTQLGNREAAAILGNLSPERAAVISRTVISAERSIQ